MIDLNRVHLARNKPRHHLIISLAVLFGAGLAVTGYEACAIAISCTANLMWLWE